MANKDPWAPLDVGVQTLTLEQTTERTCKWPLGETTPWRFCGHPTAEGKPYCPTHCTIAYRPIDLAHKLRPPRGA